MAFKKPLGWHFVDIRDVGKLAKGQQLAVDDLDLEELFNDEGNLPLVTMSQDRVSAISAVFSPSITFYLTRMPEISWLMQALDHLGPTLPPVGNAQNEMREVMKYLPEATILSEPVELSISDCPAAHYSLAFEFRHQNLAKPVHARQQTLSIIHLPVRYMICMYDSPYLGKEKTYDFEDFVKSIKLV
jgi:hypothetical protein